MEVVGADQTGLPTLELYVIEVKSNALLTMESNCFAERENDESASHAAFALLASTTQHRMNVI